MDLGDLHIMAAVGSMVAGAIVLARPKRNRAHKTWGYLYVVFMALLNGTALCIYKLSGSWGPFHFAALVSMATVLMGIIPMFLQKPNPQLLYRHMAFMYFSVVGLYAAFFSEVFSRLWHEYFVLMVSLATAITMLVGAYLFVILRKRGAFS